MSNFKDRFVRVLRANLNDVLDRIQEFEEEGGFEQLLEDIRQGRGRQRLESEREAGREPRYTPPRPEDEKTIEDYYANLEVSYGAELEEVKTSYRRLMRKYHPDRFSDDEEMRELATELSQELSFAYAKVKEHIQKKKR